MKKQALQHAKVWDDLANAEDEMALIDLAAGHNNKLVAAQALEGSFSSEGLAAMAGDDASVQMALVRSLLEHIDEGDCRRTWKKVAAKPAARTYIPPADDVPSLQLKRRAARSAFGVVQAAAMWILAILMGNGRA